MGRSAGIIGRVVVSIAVVSVGAGLVGGAASADTTTADEGAGTASVDVSTKPTLDPAIDTADRDEVSARGLWTESSRTWLTGDGQYRSELFATPVNYRDQQGEWAKIDTTVVSSGEPGFGWQNQAGPVTTLFPKSLGEGGVQLQSGDTWVDFELSGAATGTVDVDGNSVTYGQVYAGVDVNYQVLSHGAKETLVLGGPTAPRTFTFAVTTSDGVTLRDHGDGSASVIDATGEPVFDIGQVFAEDARGEVTTPNFTDATTDTRSGAAGEGGSAGITTDWVKDGDTDQLVVSLTDEWADADERAWPVLIDPPVLLNTGDTGRDCFINKTQPTTSNCTDTRVKVGATSSDPRRGLLYFNPSGIPGSVVESAELRLWCQTIANAPATVQVRRITAPVSGTSWTSWNGTATWNKRVSTGSGTAWTDGPGGDFSTAVFGSRSIAAADCGVDAGYRTWTTGDNGKSMTELVTGWVEGTWPNDGMMVRSATETNSKLAEFYSGDASASSKWPVLQVISSRPSGLEGGGFQNVIAVHPTNPDIVVSGGDVSGIHLTRDGGHSWSSQNTGLTKVSQLKVASLAWVDDDTVLALVGNGDDPTTNEPIPGGVLHGTLASNLSEADNGAWIKWAFINGSQDAAGNGGDPGADTGLPGDSALPKVKAPGAAASTATINPKADEHPRSVGRLLAVDASAGKVYVGSYKTGLWRVNLSAITNASPTWTQLGLAGQFIRSIDLSANGSALYVSTYRGPNGASANNGGRVWRITNPAATTPVVTEFTGPDDPADGIAPTNVEELRIIAGTLYGVADARHSSAATYSENGVTYINDSYGNNPRGLFRLPGAANAAATAAWSPITDSVDVSGNNIIRPDVSTGADPCNGGAKNQIWSSLDGFYDSATGKTKLWLGARNPACEILGGQKIAITRITGQNDWTTITSAALPSTEPSEEVFGAVSRTWWVADTKPSFMLGKGTYTPSAIAIDPADDERLFVAGRSGVWTTSDNGTTWAAAVRSMAVTINRDILLDSTTTPDTLDIGNVDYRHITSITGMNTVTANTDLTQPGEPADPTSQGPSVVYALARDSADALIAGVGARDTNTLGGVHWRDTADAWRLIEYPSGVVERPIGLITLGTGTSRSIVAAVAGKGIYQSLWNPAVNDYGNFTQIAGTPTFTTLTKRASIVQGAGNDNSIYVYDTKIGAGIYRGTWTVSGGIWTWNWTPTPIYNYPSPPEGTGYLAPHPTNKSIIYATAGATPAGPGNGASPAKVFRIDNADTAPTNGATVTDLPDPPAITNPGPITVNPDGLSDSDNLASIIVVERPTSATEPAQLWSVDPDNFAQAAKWKSRKLDGLTSQPLYPLDITYNPNNGNTYIATLGNGVYTTYLPNPT